MKPRGKCEVYSLVLIRSEVKASFLNQVVLGLSLSFCVIADDYGFINNICHYQLWPFPNLRFWV